MNTIRTVTTLAIALLLCGFSLATELEALTHAPDARMLRFPDISAEQIVFSYAGDLWTAPKGGGSARRLSSPKGQEMFPKFSPDGQLIAFSGNYDGNTDVYIMSAHGGTPRRLTHHSAGDLVVEWYPDGEHVLYRSGMKSPSRRFNQFYKQPIEGGLPETLALPYGELASFSPDGTRIAFQFISREFRTWKRYRGGMASDLWLYDFVNNTSEKFADSSGTDALPMWHEDTIYFLSDRGENEKLNLWAYELRTKQTRQVTRFSEYDVKWPSLGPDAIVFENAGRLHVLDLATEESQAVEITVPADLPHVRTELKNVSNRIESWSLSPSGKRALFEARGEVFTVPAKHGSIRNLTNTSGVAERDPRWSPDGKHVAYFSDETGEYELYLRSGDGKGKEEQITEGGSAFRYWPLWSPDSEKIAFSDKTGSLFVLDVNNRQIKFVDKDEWSRMASYTWSPDSRWLTYAKRGENRNGNIMIYDANDGTVHQVTSDFYDDARPVFDVEGKYLFFLSNRAFNPLYGDLDWTFIYPLTTQIYAATLTEDLDSPLAPRSDEEEVEDDDGDKEDEEEDDDGDEEKDEDSGDEEPNEEDSSNGEDDEDKKSDKDKKDKNEVEPVEIDFEGFEHRVVEMPMAAGNYGELRSVTGKLLFARYLPRGARKPGEPSGQLLYYDLKEREEKTVLNKIDGYEISADGKKIIYKSKGTYGIVDVGANKKVGDGKLASGDLKAWIDPQEEWRQIFVEAWRVQRDFFYDPNMHGVDWVAMRERYGNLLPYVVHREDLNYIIGEMFGELNASHAYVRGGDMDQPERLNVGLLGCDFELDSQDDAYRISRIYEGAGWNAEPRSPLRAPGVDVNEGDYLLAVNGRPLDTSHDPWAAFQALAGETVTLAIGSTPDINDANDFLVKPMSNEFRLRNLAWIQSNRQKVAKATEGRVGYIYVPDTSYNGQNELVRQFGGQWTKDALIIDERFNSGGQIPDRFIELLNRPLYNFWARRDHRDWQTPFLSNTGPKVMIINGWAGSGGDAFPYYFREAELGPLVGTRTWGGLIGISGNPRPIDGGFISAPTFGFYEEDGQWGVEGYGVDPDYEVENAPHEMVAGRDPQLETAIAVVLRLLERNPPQRPKKPPYPDRSPGAD
jgi:tricorn protease